MSTAEFPVPRTYALPETPSEALLGFFRGADSTAARYTYERFVAALTPASGSPKEASND